MRSFSAALRNPQWRFQSQKIVHTWLDPIEILTATAAIYILVVFAVSALGKALADLLRRRYGLAVS